jgi:hypothetical protein
MRVTGFKLREAIQLAKMRLEAFRPTFKKSTASFHPESADKPSAIADEIKSMEDRVLRLSVVQEMFNTSVYVTVGSESMTLLEVLKRIGMSDRMRKMWLEVVKEDRYSRTDVYRDKTAEYATAMVSEKDVLQQADRWAKEASRMRASLAEGNSKEMDIEGLDEGLFS